MKKIHILLFKARFFIFCASSIFCFATGFSQTTYIWNQTGAADWTVSTNWGPTARTAPAPNDILVFNNAAVTTPTNIPTQTVGQLLVIGNTTVNLQAAAASTILTISGATDVDLLVDGGSALNITTANDLTITLANGATGSITGNMTFTGGQHRLDAADASGIIFNAPAVFTQGVNCTGNVFTAAGTPNAVVFSTGTTFIQNAGANPFGLPIPDSKVVFNSGSLFKMQHNALFGTQNRTYANFEIDFASFNQTETGGMAPVTIDNLTITQGILNMNLTASSGVILKGNLSVAPGATLNFNPASAGSISFNGTTPQAITNNGTLTFGANEVVEINNAAGLTLNNNITLNSLLTLTNGVITVPAANTLTLSSTSSLAGASNASYVNGKVQKIGNSAFVFPVGKPAEAPFFTGGYVPIEILNPANGAVATDSYTAEYIRGNSGAITAIGLARVSGRDHWTLDRVVTNAASTVDVGLYWTAESSDNGSPQFIADLPSLVVAQKNGTDWSWFGSTSLATGNVIAGKVVYAATDRIGPFAIGSINFSNPLPAIVNYLTGVKQADKNLLNWQVSCTNNAEVKMIVERAAADKKYNTVTVINATAARCQQPFDYTDNSPVQGINYYRLKVVTPKGKETYSNNIAIINSTTGFDIVSLMPNIVATTTQLNIASAKKTKLNVVITDIAGRPVYKQLYNAVAGSNLFSINMAHLSAGIYLLTATTAEGEIKTVRLVKE